MTDPREIVAEIPAEQLDRWNSARRGRGRPSKALEEEYAFRDQIIVQIAKSVCSDYRQTIRHIYYVASGLGVVGKDHGGDTYWYNIVADAINAARWRGGEDGLSWTQIADDSRPFNQPTFWNDSAEFLEDAIGWFEINRWANQTSRTIVVCEKDAIFGILTPLCREHQVPLMSFHGQASNGGGVYELAKYILNLRGHCGLVSLLYLGDHDGAGLVIDRSVFGDKMADPQSEEGQGKLRRLILQLIRDEESEYSPPRIEYFRIGTTAKDVCDSAYKDYLLEANEDNFFERYEQDVAPVEDFPQIAVKGRGLVPATLGVDALGAEELIARTKEWIDSSRDAGGWEDQQKVEESEREKLEKAREQMARFL